MTETIFFGKRVLLVCIAIVVVISLLLAFGSGGPQDEIEEKLVGLALAGSVGPSDPARERMQTLQSAVNAALADDVVIRIADVDGDLNGKAAVLAQLQEVVLSVTEMKVALRGLAVTPGGPEGVPGEETADDGARGAESAEWWQARFVVDAEGAGPYGSLRDSRRVNARFEDVDGDWMLTFADVSARDDAEPEERP